MPASPLVFVNGGTAMDLSPVSAVSFAQDELVGQQQHDRKTEHCDDLTIDLFSSLARDRLAAVDLAFQFDALPRPLVEPRENGMANGKPLMVAITTARIAQFGMSKNGNTRVAICTESQAAPA